MSAPFVSVLMVSLGLPMLVSAAQPPRQPDGARLARAIDRLSVTARVLYVAAHPDDENTRLLTWLANDRLVRTAYLSLTRGDGGQNLIGSEQGVDLGLVRTQELLAARAVDGAEQWFTRARDFGFSKSPEETLRIWGKDEVLADVVRVVRRYRPDVIVTRFPTSGLDTHGHHTASAILAGEAYTLAGDPRFRPELGPPWQAKRLVYNKAMFGAKPGDPAPEGHLAIDVGGYDAALGRSYGEISAQSRSMHKSQGFGSAGQRGPSLEYFKVTGGEAMKGSLFDGVELGWGKTAGGKRLSELLARARKGFDPAHPDKALPLLAAAHAAMAQLPDSALVRDKRAELEEVMVACAGLHLEAISSDREVVPGATLPVTLSALDRTPAKVELLGVRTPDGLEITVGKTLEPNKPWTLEQRVTVGAETPLSDPYWLERSAMPGLFTVPDAALIGLPERAPLSMSFTLSVAGVRIEVTRAIFNRSVDPVAGERYRAVEVLPPVTVTPLVEQLLFVDDKPRPMRVRVKAHGGPAQGEVKVALPSPFRVEPAARAFTLPAKDAEVEVVFQVQPSPIAGDKELRVVAELDHRAYAQGLVRIEHAHIPPQTRLPYAFVRCVRMKLEHARHKIGYVAGAGDEVPAALRQVGYDVTLLTDEVLESEPLGKWEAIVTGVRAFNTNLRLPFLHERLMAYVAGGGTLLVQYSTQNRISKAPSEIGPYPFQLSQERVTDENATITRTPHAVLERPNRIDDGDFAGWVQERGLYFASTWDKAYETPLSMHDPGEPARLGGLLIARHGKGTFIYTGLSFFRQLPAGVPGAFRLFANLIDAGR